MTAACWADPLNREQRQRLAKSLTHATEAFTAAAGVPGKGRRSLMMLVAAADEMLDLRLDVWAGVPR